MTKKKEKQLLCEDNLRHNEYYGMQSTIDNLYQASANGEVFTDLMSVILQRENIMLAYRNIKKNTGSKTSGTDNLTLEDIGKCTPDEVVEKVRFIVNGSKHGYRPKPVRRKEIPKPYDPSKTRPLGIPCIWDRLVQQCIKQVMEPVCEAKFSKSKMIRYVAGTNEPIYPIGYTQHKNPLFRKKSWNYYTPEGREGIHDCLRINVSMMLALMRMPTYSNSAEYADNRISLFSAQWGKCAVTGDEFSHIGEIHCHHKLPRHLGGDDSYGNLVLIKDAVHKLIHASNTETIHKYMDLLQLDSKRLAKVNNLRQLASMQPI